MQIIQRKYEVLSRQMLTSQLLLLPDETTFIWKADLFLQKSVQDEALSVSEA